MTGNPVIVDLRGGTEGISEVEAEAEVEVRLGSDIGIEGRRIDDHHRLHQVERGTKEPVVIALHQHTNHTVVLLLHRERRETQSNDKMIICL